MLQESSEYAKENYEYLKKLSERLLDKALWATQSDTPENVAKYLKSCMEEIEMRYNRKTPLSIHVGDIVKCYYGENLAGENYGISYALVCHFNESKMPLLIPIGKVTNAKASLNFKVPENIVYYNSDIIYKSGALMLEKASYQNNSRIMEIVGKCHPRFLKSVLRQLPCSYDFTDAALQRELQRTKLERIINPVLNELSCIKDIRQKALMFVSKIDMNVSEPILVDAFIIACNQEDFTLLNIVSSIKELYPDKEDTYICAIINNSYNYWLDLYFSDCRKPEFTDILKRFAKSCQA
jgi:uncharacterized protein YqfB (UPF0267 family)